MASKTLSVAADRGYFKSEEILVGHDAGITAYVPKPMTSGAKADGRFNNDAFIYNAAKNEYVCPAGEALIWRYTNVEKGLTLHRYWSSKCRGCAMKPQCTPSTQRRVRRWEHESVLEEMQNRLSNATLGQKRTVRYEYETRQMHGLAAKRLHWSYGLGNKFLGNVWIRQPFYLRNARSSSSEDSTLVSGS
ncbi:hypothetical protein PS710_00577 [Pseudomonas fluorescens]|uniref:Transposase DDE domain-containing protein n=1 Tax=Pseudomonas fluorescens TaxID=294 RepID=A0A5E7A3G0_PSEFL|nr:hypothetical protein PS710_00577 [Pseudomonas fluorescens]